MSRRSSVHLVDKELRQLAKRLEAQGWEIDMTKGGHVRFSKGEAVVYGSSTASDFRAIRNLRTQLRKKGADV